MKILLMNGNQQDKSYFKQFGTLHDDMTSLENCNLVIFTGGADISPSYYGHQKLPTTMTDIRRDREEMAVFTAATVVDIPMIGICRGAQLLCVANNGKLVQHVEGHHMGTHKVITRTGSSHNVIGDHHQMMWPRGEFGIDYVYEAYAEGLSSEYRIGSDEEWPGPGQSALMEPEVVFWPRTRSLGVQYHPEWGEAGDEGDVYFRYLFDHYIMS